jgi:hypothetical protein
MIKPVERAIKRTLKRKFNRLRQAFKRQQRLRLQNTFHYSNSITKGENNDEI